MGFTVPDVPKTLDDLNLLQNGETQDQNGKSSEDDSDTADNKSLNMAGGVTYNPETGEATVDNDATEEDIPPIDNTNFVLDKNDIDQDTLEKLLLTSPIIGEEEAVEEEEEIKADEEVLEDEEELLEEDEASTEDFEASSVAMIKSAQEEEEVVAMPPPFGKKDEVALPMIGGGITQPPASKEFQPVDLASTFKESEPHYGSKEEDEPYVRWPESNEEVGEDTKSGLSDDGDGAPPHLSDDGEGPPPQEIELENKDENELPKVDEETVIEQEEDNGYDEPEGEKENVDIATTEEEVEEEEGQVTGDEENWEGFHLDTKDKKIDLATVDHHKNGESHNASELQNVNDYEGDGMGYKVLPPKIRGGKGGGGHPATVALILIPLVLLCACCMLYRRKRKRLPPKGRYSAIGSDDFFNGTFSDDLSYGGKSSDDGGDWNPNDSFDSDDESNGVSLEMGGIHETDANGGLSLDEVNG